MQCNTNARTSTRSELASALAAHTGRHAHAPPSRNTIESRPKDDTHATTQHNTTSHTNQHATHTKPATATQPRSYTSLLCCEYLPAGSPDRPPLYSARKPTHTYIHTYTTTHHVFANAVDPATKTTLQHTLSSVNITQTSCKDSHTSSCGQRARQTGRPSHRPAAHLHTGNTPPTRRRATPNHTKQYATHSHSHCHCHYHSDHP
jgi:hypothetical protein